MSFTDTDFELDAEELAEMNDPNFVGHKSEYGTDMATQVGDEMDSEPDLSDDYDIYGGCEWGAEHEAMDWEDDCYDC